MTPSSETTSISDDDEKSFDVSLDAGLTALPDTSLIRLDQFRADPRFSGIDGHGVSVVVIDTGIDLNNGFFGADADNNGVADRIVYSYDFSGSDDSNASDTHSHGSNVASIVGSQDSLYRGMAPGVNIIALKVFPDGSSSAADSDIVEALNWVVANSAAYDVVAVNMSLGQGDNQSSATSSDFASQMATLVANDVAVVVSSGNSYAGYQTRRRVLAIGRSQRVVDRRGLGSGCGREFPVVERGDRLHRRSRSDHLVLATQHVVDDDLCARRPHHRGELRRRNGDLLRNHWKQGGADQYAVWLSDAYGNLLSNPTGVVSGSSVALQSAKSGFGQDLNGDGTTGLVTTAIEAFGSDHPRPRSPIPMPCTRQAARQVLGLRFDGSSVTAGQFGAWNPIAAEATAGGYQVAWKMAGADQYSMWLSDAYGNLLSNPTGGHLWKQSCAAITGGELPPGSQWRRDDGIGGRADAR